MWYGWSYRHVTGTWERPCEGRDRVECASRLAALVPRPRTNLHHALTQGSYPQWVPPHPRGDGTRRDE